MKTYSNRSNALRGAKAAGYQVSSVEIVAQDGGFIFRPTTGTEAATTDPKPSPAGEEMPVDRQPTRVAGKNTKAPPRRSKAASPQKPSAAKAKGAKAKSGEKAKSGVKAKAPAKGKAVRDGGKGGLLETMLKRRGGASVPDLLKATGWQAHTLRARISTGARQNRWKVARERKAGVTVYRIGG